MVQATAQMVLRSQSRLFVVKNQCASTPPSPRELADLRLIAPDSDRYKAAVREIAILKRIKDSDPGDKRHLVRLLRTFEWKGHLCLVFEGLRYTFIRFALLPHLGTSSCTIDD